MAGKKFMIWGPADGLQWISIWPDWERFQGNSSFQSCQITAVISLGVSFPKKLIEIEKLYP